MAGVKTVLSLAQRARNPCLRGRKGGIQVQGRGWALSIWEMSIEITQVSDCVVVSTEVSPAGVIHVLNHCFGASVMVFRAGFLCRGYVTRGKIVHTDQHFFGTGYVRAYEHERTVSMFQKGEDDAGTPFIEVDPAVCRYVAEEGDECVKMMFGRMVESDEHGTAISPFPALKKIPATIVRPDFD